MGTAHIKAIVFALALSFAAGAWAAVMSVTSTSQMDITDRVDWGPLGPSGSYVPQPFHITSDHGLGMTVWKNNSSVVYQRIDLGSGYTGGFATGDHLLYALSPTAFDIKFDRPVRAVGTQLQRTEFGAFVAYVLAFSGDTQIGALQLGANTSNASDGSASFVGIKSDSRNITRVLFDSYFGGWCYINELRVQLPEPGAAGVAIVGLFALLRRTRTSRLTQPH